MATAADFYLAAMRGNPLLQETQRYALDPRHKQMAMYGISPPGEVLPVSVASDLRPSETPAAPAMRIPVFVPPVTLPPETESRLGVRSTVPVVRNPQGMIDDNSKRRHDEGSESSSYPSRVARRVAAPRTQLSWPSSGRGSSSSGTATMEQREDAQITDSDRSKPSWGRQPVPLPLNPTADDARNAIQKKRRRSCDSDEAETHGRLPVHARLGGFNSEKACLSGIARQQQERPSVFHRLSSKGNVHSRLG
ncbi:hypothetical protein BV898_10727 [Hypsibius exemplaris]|uniref:Uncharacterized protein n=1 Tax=Hypsibius exemplaris TaxID=2072580 RepID=A0A1W0WIT2_HYPEX|nr:hypothetical protein BV898_10727 [Hypsibius exemplaris]